MISINSQLYTALFITSCVLLCTGCRPDVTSSQVANQKEDSTIGKVLETDTVKSVVPNKTESAAIADTINSVNNEPVTQIEAKGKEPDPQKDPKNNKKPVKKSSQPKKLPGIKFDLIRYDFGTIIEGDTVDYNFKFTNTGKASLEIDSAKVTCGCTQPSYPFMPIEVGENGFIGVRYVSVGKDGDQEPLITVYSNASKEPTTLMLKGEVISERQDSLRKVALLKDTMSSKTSVSDTLK